nr:choice-of-anchor D domain-containing protein [Spirochaetota bacterium]
MKRIVKISAQLALLLALSGAMSCESMLDEMASSITSLRQQYVALLLPKPLPEVAVTYEGHTVSPGELIEMGTTYSDDTNTITLTITNIGTVPVNVTSITIKGWYADRFTVAGFTPTRLASNNDTTTFSVTFQGEPYDRYKAATVSIITADDEGDDYAPFNITVACERMEVMRGILAVRLGLLTVPDDYLYNMGPSTSRFTLKNIGTEVLSIKSVAHGDMDNFSVSGSVSETVIPVNGSVYIDVTFEPDDAGTYTDLITITYNDVPGGEDLTFDLNLCGYAEEVYSYEIDLLDADTGVSRPSGFIHDFGGQDYGTQGEGKTFSITNTGTGILELTSIILADGNNFTLVPPTGMVVLPDDSIDFTVYYNPITAGTHQSAITIISNDPDETAYVLDLLGHSMQPGITVEPPPEGHDFFDMGADGDYNTVTGKQASAFRVFTVRNSGDGDLPLNITVPVLSGTGAADFDLNTAGFETSLDAGQSTTFAVRFDPLSTGQKTA